MISWWRRVGIAAGMLAVILVVVIVWWVGLREVRVQKDYDKTIRIAVILPHEDDGYWSVVEEGILQAEKENEAKVDVQVCIPQLNYNTSQMVELINRQIAAKVDAVVVQGIDEEAYFDALKRAVEKGIQVVMVDTDMEEFPNHLYIGTDNHAAGVLMGKELVKLTCGSSKIAVISGMDGYLNLKQRYEGLQEAIKDYSDIEILRLDYDNYDALTVMKLYHQIREENPEVDTLVCIEGTAGQTFGTVFAEKQRDFEHILVFDLTEFTKDGMRSGMIDGIVVQNNWQMGYRAVLEIIHYREHGGYTEDTIFTPIYWYSKENLKEENDAA